MARLPVMQNRVKEVLKPGDEVRANDVAVKLGLERKAVSAVFKRMEAAGDLVRVSSGLYRYVGASHNGQASAARAKPSVVVVEDSLVKQYRRKRTDDQRVSDALEALFPEGLKGVAPVLLLQWVDLTKELIG